MQIKVVAAERDFSAPEQMEEREVPAPEAAAADILVMEALPRTFRVAAAAVCFAMRPIPAAADLAHQLMERAADMIPAQIRALLRSYTLYLRRNPHEI